METLEFWRSSDKVFLVPYWGVLVESFTCIRRDCPVQAVYNNIPDGSVLPGNIPNVP